MQFNNMRRVLIAVSVSVLVVVAAYAFMQQSSASQVTFTTLRGERIRLADLRGTIVLVNFWATSCGICLQEMPDLIAAYRQYHQRGFEVIAVAMPYDDLNTIRAYAAKQGLPFPVVFDQDGMLSRGFGQVSGTPTSILVDKSGKAMSRTVGIINFEKLHAFLEKEATR